MTQNTGQEPSEGWREEYRGMKALGKYQSELIENGPKSLAQRLDDASYVQRLEEEERNRRSRTTRLPEQYEGMGRINQEIPDPWWD
tara:strand:- start:114 stop:371 length:258 start_codon:yes stop_codon:yes gene_type:complete